MIIFLCLELAEQYNQFVVMQVLQSGLFTEYATEYLPQHVAVLEHNENVIT